jgi:hypothetical protein
MAHAPISFKDHKHNSRREFRSAMTPQHYGAVVGSVDPNTERAISGHSGDHLQFYINVSVRLRYQVDVNTQSKDGTAVGIYVADETGQADPNDAPSVGVFSDAQLSYQALGLTDNDFQAINFSRLDALLEAALSNSVYVAAYGHLFDDGGDDGKGVHDIHFVKDASNEDGALAIYTRDAQSSALKRTWFFFKFQEDHI